MALTVSSTTDTQAEVNAAAGIVPEPEVQEAEQPKEQSQRPPKVPPEPKIPDEDEEEGEEQPDEEEKPQPVKKVGGFQRKIQKLEQEKDYAFRRMMALEEQLRNGHPPQQPQQQPQRPQGEPKASDFSDYDEYTNAMIDYRVNQKLEAHSRQLEQQQRERQQEEQVSTWRNRVGEFKSEAQDFDDVLANVDHIELTPALQQAIIEDDMGPKLAYELARHSDVFERIARLSPLAAIKALGEFKASLNTVAPAPPQRKPVSQAPEPIRPVANGAGATVTKPLDQLSYQDYKRAREKQIAARRNR